MIRVLHLAHDLRLPLELVTESVGILAVKRAGKSHTAKKLVEQLHAAKQQVVVVDPKGDWWGLRSSADGKGPGIPIVILGGEHGDVPLEPGAGELVAKMVVEQRVSVLLDLAELRKHQVATFMTAFLETLYRLKAKELYRTPLMLVIDEADAIAPQRPQKGEERMLGAAEDIVRRGGQRGIGIVLVSQRAAVLNKNVLTQVGVLILLRTTGSQDIDAVDEWIKKHGQQEKREKVMASIAALPRGTAWVWAPGWPDERGIFRQVTVSPCDTFDSGATPKPGEQRVLPKTVADVDLVAFRKEMAATIEKAKAEDPRELRRQLAESRAEIERLVAGQIAGTRATAKLLATQEKRVEVPVLKAAQLKRLEYLVGRLEAIEKQFAGWRAALDARAEDVRAAAAEIAATVRAKLAPPSAPVVSPRTEAVRQQQRAGTGKVTAIMVSRRTQPGEPLPKGERAVLTAIAQHGDAGVTRQQLTVLTGYKRSTRDAYLQRLGEKAFVQIVGDRLSAAAAGIDALGDDYNPLPTGEELRVYWLARLPEGEARVLGVLVDAYPKAVERDLISAQTDYKRSTRDAYLQRLSARELVTDAGRGAVRASETLFA